jgi:hypothetical protein
VENWASLLPRHRFDSPNFDAVATKRELPLVSPKLVALVDTIRGLDAADAARGEGPFKHVIFSDLRAEGFGAKAVAGALMAHGFVNALVQPGGGGRPVPGLLAYSDRAPRGAAAPPQLPLNLAPGGATFGLLSSTTLWNAPSNPAVTRLQLRVFNERPRNVHGAAMRFLVLDSGFREGVDCFDVKYVHLFEPLLTEADATQAVGRATRVCGQRGLRFVPAVGHVLEVRQYYTAVPTALLGSLGVSRLFDVVARLRAAGGDAADDALHRALDAVTRLGAVDEPLTAALRGAKRPADAVVVEGGDGGHNLILEEKALPLPLATPPPADDASNASNASNATNSDGDGDDGATDGSSGSSGSGSDGGAAVSVAAASAEAQGAAVVAAQCAAVCADPSPGVLQVLVEAWTGLGRPMPATADLRAFFCAAMAGDAPFCFAARRAYGTLVEANAAAKAVADRAIAVAAAAAAGLPPPLNGSASVGADPAVDALLQPFGFTQQTQLQVRTPFTRQRGRRFSWYDLRELIKARYGRWAWAAPVVEDACPPPPNGPAPKPRLAPLQAGGADDGGANLLDAGGADGGSDAAAAAANGGSDADRNSGDSDGNELDPSSGSGVESESDDDGGGATPVLNAPPAAAPAAATALVPAAAAAPGAAARIAIYNQTQSFLSEYFRPSNPVKGMLWWHTVGTGKTCTAIAVASRQFEPAGYHVLWVTRRSLLGDLWKNVIDGAICHAAIADDLREGRFADTPAGREGRKAALLRTSWLDPITYRQFSNLFDAGATGERNPLKARLRALNGAADPLRKTLIVIDEAHKLTGTDFKPGEQPNYDVLLAALRHSYAVSGADSARVLLMTGTPYNETPFEMLRLLNLARPADEALPTEPAAFRAAYCDAATGGFSPAGLEAYLDAIAGQVSFLDRSRDASQFAQPAFTLVPVPLSTYTPDPAARAELARGLRHVDAEAAALEDKVLPALTADLDRLAGELAQRRRACVALAGDSAEDAALCDERQQAWYHATRDDITGNLAAAKARLASLRSTGDALHEQLQLLDASGNLPPELARLTQQYAVEARCQVFGKPRVARRRLTARRPRPAAAPQQQQQTQPLPGPANNGATAPVNNGAAAPVNNGAAAPVNSGTPYAVNGADL